MCRQIIKIPPEVETKMRKLGLPQEHYLKYKSSVEQMAKENINNRYRILNIEDIDTGERIDVVVASDEDRTNAYDTFCENNSVMVRVC